MTIASNKIPPMKIPQAFAGWASQDGKVHNTQVGSIKHELINWLHVAGDNPVAAKAIVSKLDAEATDQMIALLQAMQDARKAYPGVDETPLPPAPVVRAGDVENKTPSARPAALSIVDGGKAAVPDAASANMVIEDPSFRTASTAG